MDDVIVRPAVRSDLPEMTAIYNHYVETTPITFDIKTFTPDEREPWFREHTEGGRYRMFVAEERGLILGYAGTARHRDRAAYDTTVESTIYCADTATRRGIGARLYTTLFDALRDEDINRIVAGITVPNEASVALHRRCGFQPVGIFSENGRKFGRYWDVLWMERPLAIR